MGGRLPPEYATDAKKAFRAGTITRSVAEALTLGSKEQQRAVLDGIESDYPPEPEEIREMLIGGKPSLSMAVFPRERYSGTLTTDLFADDETTYFDDVDQFLALQRDGVEELAAKWRERAAWVEVLHLYTVPWWHYRDAAADEPAGVVINLHPSGSVEVRDGLARHEVKETVVEATRQTPLAPRPAPKRPEFTAELVRYVACQKSAAVEAALLHNPRKAKEVAGLLLLLGFRTCIGARLSLHPCHGTTREEQAQQSHRAINQAAAGLADRLGLDAAGERESDVARLTASCGAVPLYEALGRLADDELDRLLVLLPILCFGEERLAELDTGESLFNRIAAGIGITMRAWWVPDAVFLSALTREQILAIAAECGAAKELRGLHGWTKKQLVEELARYFAERSDPARTGGADDGTAREWLPGLLRFPATKIVTADAPAP
jgi:ParB family transcriptional regulator, chromosome partitioning protein